MKVSIRGHTNLPGTRLCVADPAFRPCAAIHIAQSGAILRFVANIAGNLIPPDHFKAAQVDATYGT